MPAQNIETGATSAHLIPAAQCVLLAGTASVYDTWQLVMACALEWAAGAGTSLAVRRVGRPRSHAPDGRFPTSAVRRTAAEQIWFESGGQCSVEPSYMSSPDWQNGFVAGRVCDDGPADMHPRFDFSLAQIHNTLAFEGQVFKA